MKNIYIDLVPPSFGQPEPLGIRVFSTLNSPGVLSTYLMVILSVAVSQPGWKGALCRRAGRDRVLALAGSHLVDRLALISMLFLLILPAKADCGNPQASCHLDYRERGWLVLSS